MAKEPYDDTDIQDDDAVIRRVAPEHHVVYDENIQGYRTSSKLFTPSSGKHGGMSVDMPKLMEAEGVDAPTFVTTPRFTGSVVFNAIAAREKNLRIGYDPIEENPYHGEVWGPPATPNKFSKGQSRALARASEWFVRLPGVELKG